MAETTTAYGPPVLPSIAPSVAYFTLGVVTLAVHAPFFFVIWSNPNRRWKKEWLIITALGGSDCIQSFSYVWIGLFRLEHLADPVLNVPLYVCTERVYVQLYVFSFQLVGWITLALAVDRLLIITQPIRYSRIAAGAHLTLFFVVPVIISLTTLIINYVLSVQSSLTVSNACLAINSGIPAYANYLLISRISLVGISAVLFLVVIYKIRNPTAKNAYTPSRHSERSARATTISIAFSVLDSFLLLFIPDFLYLTNVFAPIAPVYSVFAPTKALLNVFIFAAGHRGIREDFRKRFRTAKTSVAAKISSAT